MDHLFFDDHDPLHEMPLTGGHESGLGSYDTLSSGMHDSSFSDPLNDPALVETNQVLDQGQELIHQVESNPHYGEHAPLSYGQHYTAPEHPFIPTQSTTGYTPPVNETQSDNSWADWDAENAAYNADWANWDAENTAYDADWTNFESEMDNAG